MNKRFIYLLSLVTVFYCFLYIGCAKETSGSSTLSLQQEQTIASVSTQSEIETQLAFNDVFDNVMGANNQVGMAGTGVFGNIEQGSNGTIQSGRGYGTDSTHCFIISAVNLGSGIFPLKLIIDFGNGCLGKDGHIRYGKIITVYSGRLTIPGKSASTTFENYRIDSFSISGTQIITNTTTGSQRQFTVNINNCHILKPSGDYEDWNCQRIIDQVQGNGTPDWPLDDVFSINGSSYGKVQKGNELYAWKAEIIHPLIKEFICPWILEGMLQVRRDPLPASSQWTANLDYGLGSCDNKATLTINGTSRQITLH